jgi:hypothetical protein
VPPSDGTGPKSAPSEILEEASETVGNYPVTFEMDYIQERSRVTTFFRYILAIPHLLFLLLWSIAFYVVWIIAWFALLFTARWPQGLFNFSASYLRYLARLSAYLYLGLDQYPAFNGTPDEAYPARVAIDPPLAEYSRIKVFFRLIYAILAFVIRYALGIVAAFVSFLSWFAIVFTGKQPEGLQNALNFSLAYITRADALIFLITETYPPFGESS